MIWPFCPLEGMLEGLEWRTDILRAFNTEQRIRLRNTPLRVFNHQYAMGGREYERARALFRDQHPGPFELPDWGLAHRVTADLGDSVIVFDNAYPMLDVGDSVAIIQDSETYEELTISSATSTGITLSFPLTADYTNAYLVRLIDADAAESFSAGRSVQPIRAAQVEWTSYDTTDIAAAGDYQAHRSLPVVPGASCIGEATVPNVLSKPFDSVDNGIARPYRDTLQEQFSQSLVAVWQIKERAEHYALRQWFYWMRGPQKAFWLPDYSTGLTLVESIQAGQSTVTIEDIGFSDGYVTGDLFLRTTDGTVHTYQVSGSAVDSDGNEVLTLASPASATVSPADVSQLCLMFCVRIGGNRVEWQHRSVVGPRISAPVVEVPVP